MRLYRTKKGIVAEEAGRAGLLKDKDWDALLNRDGLGAYLTKSLKKAKPIAFNPDSAPLLAPIGRQEVWAAGVTYYRSRDARMDESKAAGGGDFYARVYEADRPELFFKSTPHRVSGPRQKVRIRKDSKWNVPEPELAVVVNSAGRIFGWTICNDMSSRDIEGENPLYLPQAKVYDQSCALGPCILVSEEMPSPTTEIRIEILRGGRAAFAGATALDRLKRSPESLVAWLHRDNSFPSGCFLSTGTGIVPADSFTLQSGDEVRITIPPIGTLSNQVA
ncbi:MAG TPA: fumarylacetoacetate hydrolase family protein [Planctomycetota bacterium]|nr:fumarylacetoacetate hydrolase family protein [Planctomycetota bacterium]